MLSWNLDFNLNPINPIQSSHKLVADDSVNWSFINYSLPLTNDFKTHVCITQWRYVQNPQSWVAIIM